MSELSCLPIGDVLEKVHRICHDNGTQVFLVGGVVRDLILNKTTRDIDLVVMGDASSLARRVANKLGGHFYILDDLRNTARVIINHESEKLEIDFASQRGESLELDLRDRDFTINAMAIDLNFPDHLIDPLGGAQDLRDAVLRSCSPTSIGDDPIRILRAVRLALEYKLKIDPSLKIALKNSVGFLPGVSEERKRDEIFRILDSENVASALRLLDILGLAEQLFPELNAEKGCVQSYPHTLDVWEHTIFTLQNIYSTLAILTGERVGTKITNPVNDVLMIKLGEYRQQLRDYFSHKLNPGRSLRSLLQFSALYHDAGKPGSRSNASNEKVRFTGHEVIGASMATERARNLALSHAEVKHVEKIVLNHMRLHSLAQTRSMPSSQGIYRYFRNCGSSGIDISVLYLADQLATYGVSLPMDEWNYAVNVCQELFDAYWNKTDDIISPIIMVSGNDIQNLFGIEPGPIIGDVLEAVKEAQVAGELSDRQQALRYVEKWLCDYGSTKEGEGNGIFTG